MHSFSRQTQFFPEAPGFKNTDGTVHVAIVTTDSNKTQINFILNKIWIWNLWQCEQGSHWSDRDQLRTRYIRTINFALYHHYLHQNIYCKIMRIKKKQQRRRNNEIKSMYENSFWIEAKWNRYVHWLVLCAHTHTSNKQKPSVVVSNQFKCATFLFWNFHNVYTATAMKHSELKWISSMTLRLLNSCCCDNFEIKWTVDSKTNAVNKLKQLMDVEKG